MAISSIVVYNVYTDVWRSTYSPATGQTSVLQPYLLNVRGNISPLTAIDFATLAQSGAPEPALKSKYILLVSTGTDIRENDQIVNIRLSDKKTPWEMAGPLPTDNDFRKVIWWVRFILASPPGVLSYRACYLERLITGASQPI